jgi:hypothetical protein
MHFYLLTWLARFEAEKVRISNSVLPGLATMLFCKICSGEALCSTSNHTLRLEAHFKKYTRYNMIKSQLSVHPVIIIGL